MKFHDIVGCAVQNLTQPLQGVYRDSLVMLEVVNRPGVNVILIDQCIGADLPLSHCPPKRLIADHITPVSVTPNDIYIIVEMGYNKYTEICNYSEKLKI